MPKLAANLSMLFPELDFLDRFSAAREAGFRYVEYQFPYAHVAEELARCAGDAGVPVLIEPINTRSVPGFFLTRSAQAIDVLNAVGEANAFLQYDAFHMQIMEGDLACSIERLLARIGHLQIADVPERHEPGTGEINFEFLLRHLDAIGYSGWVGCEYNPRGDTREGLKWAKPYL